MITSYRIIPVYKTDDGAKLYHLIQNHGGFWGFPKGHPENNETPEETAIREAYEETGIKLDKSKLGKPLQYEYKQPVEGTLQTKRIVLFPVLLKSRSVRLQQQEIAQHEWARFDRTIELISLDSAAGALSAVEHSPI